MRRAVLIRHCESSGQAPEAPLTARGRRQAEALAARLAPLGIDRVISSPYARARGTIEPFAAAAGLAVELDARLVERRLSPEPIESWRQVVRRSFDEPDFRVPGGESGRDVLARGRAALASALGAEQRLPALVSHGQLLSLVLHALDPGFGYAGWAAMQNPDVFLVERGPDGRLAFRHVPAGAGSPAQGSILE